MIEKVLIYGQTIYFSKNKPDTLSEGQAALPMSFPVKIFHDAESKLETIQYMQSRKKSRIEVNQHIKEFLNLCSNYAIKESDRAWIRGLIEK